MNKRILLQASLVVVLLAFSSAPAQGQTVERENILWSSGYWAGPGVNNPTHWGPSWESKFMYEVLFDFNSVNSEGTEIVGYIGESIQWTDDGASISITIRDEATWSDGEAIDADDVIYTFWDLYAAPGFPLNATFTKRIDSVERIDDHTVKFHMKSGFEYSRSAFNQFIGRWQVLPQHVWPNVIAHYASSGEPTDRSVEALHLTNDWFDEDFPENLKVFSGMYSPYSKAVDNSWSLYERNDDWWGVGVIADSLPAPTHVGMKSFPSNFAQTSDYLSDGIDWFGGYVQSIDREIEQNSNLGTYFGQEEPYFASLSSVVEIAPNHAIYPLSEHWFRESMATAINRQDMIDIGASGYLEPARVARMDDRSPMLEDLYDPTVEETYGFDYNLENAKAMMEENAFYRADPHWKWFTKDAPQWVIDSGDYVDAFPEEPGFNVAIGPYDITSVLGWSDFTLHITTFQLQMQALGVPINLDTPDYGTYVSKSQNMDFEILLYGLGPGLLDRPLNNFEYMAGPAGQGVNITGWVNPTYVDLLEQFEVAEPGSAEELTIAKSLQQEIGEDLPSIPLFANGYWYSYTTKYWEGWPTEGSGLPPVAMWSFGNTGLMTDVISGLSVATEGGSDNGDASFELFSVALAIPVLYPVVKRVRSRNN